MKMYNVLISVLLVSCSLLSISNEIKLEMFVDVNHELKRILMEDPYYQTKCQPSVREKLSPDGILLNRYSSDCNGHSMTELFFESGSIKERLNYMNLAFGYPLGLAVPADLGYQLQQSYFYYKNGTAKIRFAESVSGYWTSDQNYFEDHNKHYFYLDFFNKKSELICHKKITEFPNWDMSCADELNEKDFTH